MNDGLTAEQIVEHRAKVHRLVFHRRSDVEPEDVAALHALDAELDRLYHQSAELLLKASGVVAVHALIAGRAPCGIVGTPNKWPPGNLWARFEDFRVAEIPETCSWCDDCREVLAWSPASMKS